MVYVATGGGEGDYQDPSWLQISTAGTGGNFRGAQPSELSTSLALPYTQLAGIIGDIVTHPSQIVTGTIFDTLAGNGNGTAELSNDKPRSNRFLTYLGLTVLGLAAAPAIYRAANRPRRGKRHAGQDEIASSLDNASNRATTIISSMAPVLAFPIAYIGIDELENRRIISGKLGDDVQGLMTMMASASLLGPLGSLIKSVV